MRRAPCRPTASGSGTTGTRSAFPFLVAAPGSCVAARPTSSPGREVFAEDPAVSCSFEPGQGGEAGRPQPRLLLRAAVMGGSPQAPPTPAPEGLLQSAIRGALWAAAAGACAPLDLDLRL